MFQHSRGVMEERLDDAINILRNHAEGAIEAGNYHPSLTQLDSHVVSFIISNNDNNNNK